MGKKLTKCKTCGAEITQNANVCPHCGANLTMRKLGVIVGIVIFAIAVLCMMRACTAINDIKDSSKAESQSTPFQSTVSSTDTGETDVKKSFTLSAGSYTVGEDVQPGKYDCVATNGAGTFQGQVFGVDTEYLKGYNTYSNLILEKGDILSITGNLRIEFTEK